ncbi:uncharacterized protein BCR38DRAFT_332538 [Pseudomassariella vexata]|uniref:AAA+ ATPase domain-containing protein n=1 Tax=Pseudomassariella vexata TaxID=1141098 RepID=A0A1Y2EFK4_9PEZI|nr:uncharacterized protein BCR38DRAFT_332538 [Pseudomassariella vexata]ORY70361.1 hypothetical protein BCR38DRAFT_332538 [Pseudomassariella vexata]
MPKVRLCNWEQFKNYFGEEEGKDAIEILVAGKQLEEDVKQELSRRFAAKEGTYNPALSFPIDTLKGSWIQRVRIRSRNILSVLATVSSRMGLYLLTVDMPTTFSRPFKSLIFIHDKVKEEVEKLRLQFDSDSHEGASLQNTNDGADGASMGPNQTSQTSNENTMLSQKPKFSKSALLELECYVKFMDEKIMPLYNNLRSETIDQGHSRKIRYVDLWFLFKPGELIYVPPQSQLGKSHSASTEQRVWRMWEMLTTRSEWRVDDIERQHYTSLGRKREEKPPENDEDGEMASGAELKCYYLDYSGTTFCPVHQSFTIDYYEDEVEITSLKAYPLRFHPKKDTIIQELKQQRAQFLTYVKGRHQLAYDGWSLVKNVLGDPIGEDAKHQEYIDSEVIIDFEETFQTYPWWKPNFFWSVPLPTASATWATDSFTIIRWKDKKRSEMVSEMQELYADLTGVVNGLESNQWLVKDRFLTLSTYIATNEPPRHENLSDDELLLLPTRLFAYALRQRKFFQIDIRYLKEIEQIQNPFQSLQIDPNHKDTIESLLHSHFTKKDLDKGPGPAIPDQDLIRGKGRGVVILLHGAPGVGKTATAEAVAQQHKKPLFAITCGDLGYEPSEVESSLTEIFRLAQVWDCILLLDEADVFLTQRSPNDLQRNAMVSTILRILEYYKGVLFLTTNRPGVLDESLKSRVHVSLHYPALDLPKTQEIFKTNLDRLELIEDRRSQNSADSSKLLIFREEIYAYATTHFQRYGTGLGSWNGRQIRNAFSIAAALAHYDRTKVPGAQSQLRASHFEKVAEATFKYDEYRKRTIRKGDADLARERDERDDTYGFSGGGNGGRNVIDPGLVYRRSYNTGSGPMGGGSQGTAYYGQETIQGTRYAQAPYGAGMSDSGSSGYPPQPPRRGGPPGGSEQRQDDQGAGVQGIFSGAQYP